LKCTHEIGSTNGKTWVTLNTYNTALLPTSSKKLLTPKDDMISGINVKTMINVLTTVRCMKMKSIGLLRSGCVKKKVYMWDPRWRPEHSHRRSDLYDPETLMRSWRHAWLR
jgi:hypothetical protein